MHNDIPLIFFSHSGFRTDTDISSSTGQAATRERELQQWQPDSAPTNTAASLAALQGDEATFGPPGAYSGQPWDQFEVNEQLFGVTTNFDEDAYTTKLDRNAPGFKERERKAQQLANEILSVRAFSLSASNATCLSP
jgi:PAB1-binding protein PBP1